MDQSDQGEDLNQDRQRHRNHTYGDPRDEGTSRGVPRQEPRGGHRGQGGDRRGQGSNRGRWRESERGLAGRAVSNVDLRGVGRSRERYGSQVDLRGEGQRMDDNRRNLQENAGGRGVLSNRRGRRGNDRGDNRLVGGNEGRQEDGRGGHHGGRGARGGGGGQGRGRGRGNNQRGGVGHGRGIGAGHTRILSFKQLLDLTGEDVSTVVMTLGLEKNGLSVWLNRENLEYEMVRVLVHLLAHACSCISAPESLLWILVSVQKSIFLSMHVTTFLSEMLQNGGHKNCEKSKQFIKNLLVLLQELSSRLPHSLTVVAGVESVLDIVVQELGKDTDNTDIIDDDIRDRQTEFRDLKKGMLDRIHRESEQQKKPQSLDDGLPPDDFRDLSIFPAAADINPAGKPFLRRNKAVGGYIDLDHYLDVQFRLLREDFISPLREGIAQYLQATAPRGRGSRVKDIRVYNDVQIIRTVCSNSGLLHRLAFDISKLSRVRWENTKRLIYGSLVCLSPDNFNTFYFATVSDRDVKLLQQGIVDVLFEHDLDEVARLSEDNRFVMVETTAYFEAYRHVLKGLQHIRDQLPFAQYIVSCESDVEIPKYLMARVPIKYDLRPLVDENIVLREDSLLRRQGREVNYAFSRESRCAENVEVVNLNAWPTPEQLHLDTSQYQALQTALTKEFVAIQGPPGTGKTYVGLKIVKALLHNASIWNSNHHRPMLIVCYTNHALDQFLEGVVSFFKGDIIRVGGRMNSETLADYSLKAKRQKARRSADRGRDVRVINRYRWQTVEAMMSLKLKIEKIGQQIEAAEREVLHEDMLRPFMGDHYNQLMIYFQMITLQLQEQGIEKPQSVLVEWLGLGLMGGEMEEEQVPANAEAVAEEEEMADAGIPEEVIDVVEEAEAEQQQRQLDDINDDVFQGYNAIEEINKEIAKLPQEKSQYVAFDVSNLDNIAFQGENEQNTQHFQIQRRQLRRLKQKLQRRLRSAERMTSAEARKLQDPWILPLNQRWKLYRFWVHQLCERLRNEVRIKEQLYRDVVNRYRESGMQEDKQLLQDAAVIGMTTTGAARYQAILSEIQPRIIVIEEAAEVLEGHVITTLSRGCEHLILIGDHQQLRPNPNVYLLAKRYNLDLSLFERMIKNNIHCDCLELQHRMRPKISRLMKHIYPNLRDHDSVLKYENVKGVAKNIFFINHNKHELHDVEMVSHSNEFEAQYIVALCSYLIKQGYERNQITVLTTYSGQLIRLKKLMPKTMFNGVRVTVVDNFQGEENDIILLSLVRSNTEGSIGFLKIENRICVALSRAKKGMYVIGNFDLLSQHSQLWTDIVGDLKKENEIGPALNLYCQNHPKENGIAAQKVDDFQKAPEGGCMKPCSFRLECGHVCVRLCHPYDPEHLDYKCNKPCSKTICKHEHPCTRKCYQECGDCKVPMSKIIPKCGHTQMVPCFMSPDKYACKEPCTQVLRCGHTCTSSCGSPHKCTQMVKKTWECGHTGDVRCEQKDTTTCFKKCKEPLLCDHICSGSCKRCLQGRLHLPCGQQCGRILVCGHKCKDFCSFCPPCQEPCGNRCSHSKCNKKCGEPCVPCREPCQWMCHHFRCTKQCGQQCNRPPCNAPCNKRLPCRHPCIGLCGEPCPTLCRQCNKEEVTTILFGSEDEPDARFVQLEDCNHIVEVDALDHWMKAEPDSDDEVSIQLKGCPHCKTPIRRNLRYGNIIKGRLNDIEMVKRKVLGAKINVGDLKRDLELQITRELDPEEKEERKDMLAKGFSTSESGLLALQNQFTFLKELSNVFDSYENLGKEKISAIPRSTIVSSMQDLEIFRQWMMKARYHFSDQEAQDAQNELYRHQFLFKMLEMEKIVKDRDIKLTSELQHHLTTTKRYLTDGKPFTEQRRKYVTGVEKEVEKVAPKSGLGISEEERVSIVKAIALNKGHWFKCKNGHIYAIGDCGGATVESRCPECKATIGGANHRLRDDNAFAPEMDGAQHAAWSEQANMMNYGF